VLSSASAAAGSVKDCLFCRIVAGDEAAEVVFSDEVSVAFLDIRPVFHGHTLLVTRDHYETLPDLPPELIEPYFKDVRLLSVAVPAAMEAQGSFVAINNVVSQSVAHLHTHVVPRVKKDGLRGFFWPRTKYEHDDHAAETAQRIRDAITVGAGPRS
jgi:histidine triad (HIT) family protein